ncbi:MAG: LysR family transcriptional regulator [Comamonas sp.]
MNVSIKQLKCFLVVARESNFTQAAKLLHTTQSAVSALIKELESEIGFKLFDRNTRNVHLTDSGVYFYQLTHKLLDEFEQLLINAADIANLKTGVVRVGATEAAACSLVVPAIKQFKLLHPHIEVRLQVHMPSTMGMALKTSEVDFCIAPDFAEGSTAFEAIEKTLLIESPILLWCAQGSAWAQKSEVLWQEVIEAELILPAMDFNTTIIPAVLEHLRSQGVDAGKLDLAQHKSVGGIMAALSMAQAGLGVTFAAEYVRPLAQSFGLKGLALREPAAIRRLSLYQRKGRTLSLASKAFVSFLQTQLQ